MFFSKTASSLSQPTAEHFEQKSTHPKDRQTHASPIVAVSMEELVPSASDEVITDRSQIVINPNTCHGDGHHVHFKLQTLDKLDRKRDRYLDKMFSRHGRMYTFNEVMNPTGWFLLALLSMAVSLFMMPIAYVYQFGDEVIVLLWMVTCAGLFLFVVSIPGALALARREVRQWSVCRRLRNCCGVDGDKFRCMK